MPTYWVTWEIDIDAESHEAAAKEARAMQLDRASTATVFSVQLNRPKASHMFVNPKYQPRTVDVADQE